MNDEFRWNVEEFVGKPPLGMILEGLGALCRTPLEVLDGRGGSAVLGPQPQTEGPVVRSPIQIRGRDVGFVVGHSSGDGDQRVPMTVALAASLISQFLRSNQELQSLAREVRRRARGLSLLERMEGSAGARDEQETARWLLSEAVTLVGASYGALFTFDGETSRPLAWDGCAGAPRAGALTGRVAREGRPLDLRSLGRLPRDLDPHEGNGCALEDFLTTPAMAVPVRCGTRVVGVLWVCGHAAGRFFDECDLELLRGVAAQIGLYLWGACPDGAEAEGED